jgi:hypothetical protein
MTGSPQEDRFFSAEGSGSTAYIKPAQKLVQAFAGIHSTEELVLFVAGTDGMLAFCQELIDQYDRTTQPPLIVEIRTICTANGVLPGALFAEIRKVLLALNRYHDAGQDHYALLGLNPNASVDEIKKAYRRLSKEFHPDSMQSSAADGKRFMEISGAYQALMVGLGKQKTEKDAPWRKKTGQRPSRSYHRNRRFSLILIIVLVIALAGFSVYLAARYNRQAAIGQLPSYARVQGSGKPAAAPPPPEDTPAVKVENAATPELQPATVAPAKPEPLAPALPIDVPPQLIQAKAETAGSPPVQPEDEPQIPPDPGQETGPSGNSARILPTATKHVIAAQVPETAHPVPAVSESNPQPAAANQETSKAAAVASVQTPDQAGPPSPAETREPPPAPPASPEAQEDTAATDNSAIIKGVIANYENHYNNRELSSFLGLFATDATENGHPVATMRDQYRNLFEHARTINLQIHDTNWDPYQAGFRIRGRFNANYSYTDGRSKAHNGDISFYLVQDHGKLKIQSLEYVFLK